MSIDEATPEEWDAIKADRYTDNRDPKEVPYAPGPDPVNSPAHYRVAEIEAIDYISVSSAPGKCLENNILKYMLAVQERGRGYMVNGTSTVNFDTKEV